MNERLKQARARKRWTQEEASENIGIARKTYIEWEQGNQLPHMSTLDLACEAFHASPEDLGYSIRSGRITFLPEEAHVPTLSVEQIASLLVLLGDNSMKFDESRRTVLQLLGLAGATLATQNIFDPEPWERLSYVGSKPSNISKQTLEQFAKINEACWYITNGTEIAVIGRVLPAYLPQLSQVARISSKNQDLAAHLTAQGYLLAGLVALDQMNTTAMERYSKLAVQYSQIAKDYNLENAAIKQQATMYLIAKNPAKALQTYQRCLPSIDEVTPLLRSRTYQGLASAAARCGQEDEAQRYIGLAYDTFPDDFEHDPAFLYADSGLSVLYMYDGITRLDLDQPHAALEAFNTVDGLAPKISIGESTRLEFINLQAKAATAMRERDATIMYIEAAIGQEKTLDSQWGRSEAWEVYQQMRLVWPGDTKIKVLAELFRQ
ncbi:MAG: helix-turn-helix transcriptional regulator [Ktedonobacteraceae bacterium]|nr:helix-turn-helix transcriptional regulator [Ktedonobacteraceae bacterium]